MTESVPVRIRPEIASLPAYAQGRQADAGAFKLSSNENPFPPLPGVVAAIQSATAVNRYPDASAARLRERLAERFAVASDEVHVAAGSVSILMQLMLASCGAGDEVIYPWRSFEAYPIQARVAGARAVEVPLTAAYGLDLDAMAAAVTERTRMIVVCTPNNPTGPAVSQVALDAFLDRVPGDILVVLDEAYLEFVTDPAAANGLRVPGLPRPNVIVLRTFSKAYGLAGLRIGYAVGHRRILDAARSTAIPLAVTQAAEDAALASLDLEDELRARVAQLVARRERLVTGLRAQGWKVPDTQANFVYLPVGVETPRVAAAFDEGGVIVRAYGDDGVRISVGEEESVDVVLRIAESVVGTLTEGSPARALA